MKKRLWILCPISICLFLACLALARLSQAAPAISVRVNGNALSFETPPQNRQGVTLVPVRALGEQLGAKMEWQPQSKTLWMFLDGRYVALIIGSKSMTKGRFGGTDEQTQLDAAPQIIGGQTLAPLRAVSEGLGCSVRWDEASNTISIQSDASATAANAQAIDTKEKLLAAMGENISAVRDKFFLDTRNLPDEVFDLDVSDYFKEVSRYSVQWWTYQADGQQNAYAAYEVTYSMTATLRRAFESGGTHGLNKKELAVYQAVKQIAEEIIQPEMDGFAKEKAVHDYLVKTIRYDESADVPEDSHTPYGALIQHTAVCSGYSETFKIFMDLLGIECDMVYGTANLDGQTFGHSWNRVRLDDQYYLVDVTWDDPFPDKPERVYYNYLNVTDEMMNKVHTPDASSNKKCVSDQQNYYVRLGFIARDENDARRIIREAIDRKESFITLRGDGYDLTKMDVMAILSPLSPVQRRVTYSLNEAFNIIHIFLLSE
ncbi:MAG: hypothetical protein LBT44_06210 [Clostridiales bacterium]|jgi:hypothetical protein|nr:hypothetical protein [Clostridiales bacterium]